MIDIDAEIDNRLVKQSIVFADYKFLQKKMPDFVLSFDCPDCSITIHYYSIAGRIRLKREDDYYYLCICEKDLDDESTSKIMDKLKEIFDFELFKEDEMLNRWCSNYAWKDKKSDKSHTHYHYRLTYKIPHKINKNVTS